MQPENHPLPPLEIGVGVTSEFNLRLSAAALVRVLFRHPKTQEWMLALERTATLEEASRKVAVIAKPFGGSVSILAEQVLYGHLGGYHYDSLQSRREADFRILIRAEEKEPAIRFCLHHFEIGDQGVLETGPMRELLEEFGDILPAGATPGQFEVERLGARVEPVPVETRNRRAAGCPTIYVYNIFQAVITDPLLAAGLLKNSRDHSNWDLQTLALQGARRTGRGRANAALVLPWNRMVDEFRQVSHAKHAQDLLLDGHRLSGNVAALLSGPPVGA